MNSMNSRTFGWNCLVGVILTLAVGGILYAAAESIYPSTGYTAYLNQTREYEVWRDRRETWLEDNAQALEQRRFEEALAGIQPPTRIRHPELRQLASSLITLRMSEDTSGDTLRATAIARLLVKESGQLTSVYLRMSGIIQCTASTHSDNCRFNQEASVLNEPGQSSSPTAEPKR